MTLKNCTIGNKQLKKRSPKVVLRSTRVVRTSAFTSQDVFSAFSHFPAFPIIWLILFKHEVDSFENKWSSNMKKFYRIKEKNEQTNKGNLKLGLQLICLEDVEWKYEREKFLLLVTLSVSRWIVVLKCRTLRISLKFVKMRRGWLSNFLIWQLWWASTICRAPPSNYLCKTT